MFEVAIDVTSNVDVNPTIVAQLNGILVEDGQQVELKLSKDDKSKFKKEFLHVEGSSFDLIVFAADNIGHSTFFSATGPSFEAADELGKCTKNNHDDDDDDGDSDD